MNEPGKSDKPVVPVKSVKMDYWEFHQQCIERMEGRGLAKEKGEGSTFVSADPAKQVDGTQRPLATSEDLPRALDRIRQAACRDRELKFTSLWHHVYNVERLREAY